MAGGSWNGTPVGSVATPPLPAARGAVLGTIEAVPGPCSRPRWLSAYAPTVYARPQLDIMQVIRSAKP